MNHNTDQAPAEYESVVEPPKVRFADQAFAITQPYIVHCRADIASMLRAHRISMDLSCEQFDAAAGFPDRYVTKLENSRGTTTGGTRQGFVITPPTSDDPEQGRAFSGNITASFMSEVWLETAGLRLVLMPAELAERIGAVPAPKKQTNPNTAKALSELAAMDGEYL